MAQNASRATPEASRKGRETVCFVLCTCGVKTWHLEAKITTHNSRQPSWLFEIPVSVTVSRASWTASTNRLLARSCFSIDLFAPKPSFTVCAWVHIQLQTTYARLLKYAWADAQTHMHARTNAHLHSSQLLQDLTHLGGQMFPSLLENKEEENFYSVTYKMHCLQCTTKVTESFF